MPTRLFMRSLKYMLIAIIAYSHNGFAQSKGKIKLSRDQAILSYDTSAPNMKYLFPTFYTSRATLTQQELSEADELLAQSVADYNRKQDTEFARWHAMDPNVTREDFVINLKDYRRQYVAVTNEQHEKEVWINALCYAAGDKWRKEVIVVDDGGKCFFSVKINLAQRKFYEMRVNTP